MTVITKTDGRGAKKRHHIDYGRAVEQKGAMPDCVAAENLSGDQWLCSLRHI